MKNKTDPIVQTTKRYYDTNTNLILIGPSLLQPRRRFFKYHSVNRNITILTRIHSIAFNVVACRCIDTKLKLS